MFDSLGEATVLGDGTELAAKLRNAKTSSPTVTKEFARAAEIAPQAIAVHSLSTKEFRKALRASAKQQIKQRYREDLKAQKSKDSGKKRPKKNTKKAKTPLISADFVRSVIASLVWAHLVQSAGVLRASFKWDVPAWSLVKADLWGLEARALGIAAILLVGPRLVDLIFAPFERRPKRMSASDTWAGSLVSQLISKDGIRDFWHWEGRDTDSGHLMHYGLLREPVQDGQAPRYQLIQVNNTLVEQEENKLLTGKGLSKGALKASNAKVTPSGRSAKRKPSDSDPDISQASDQDKSSNLVELIAATGVFPITVPEGVRISSKDEALAKFVETGKPGKAPWLRYKTVVEARLRTVMAARDIHALFRTVHMRKYKEERLKGFYGVDIDNQFRLIFRWDSALNRATDLTVLDFHGE